MVLKTTQNGDEQVYVRRFSKELAINVDNPKLTFPFFSRQQNLFIVPIYPQYHTELFPDSILNNRISKRFY